MTNSIFRHADYNKDSNDEVKDFSTLVKYHLKTKKITQVQLSEDIGLSRSTMNRICRNSNDKGSFFKPELDVVYAISFGLKLTSIEAEELFNAAFLVRHNAIKESLDKKMSLADANIILYNKELPIIGN